MNYAIDTFRATEVATVESNQKTPWVVHAAHPTVADTLIVVGVFDARGAARTFATANGHATPVKYDPSVYDCVNLYDDLNPVVETTDETATAETVDQPVAVDPVVADTTVAVETTPPAADAPAPVEAKAKADVLRASTVELPTKRVWAIASEMAAANGGALPKRSAVIARCVETGIAYYTARTQYQQWYESYKADLATAAANAEASK